MVLIQSQVLKYQNITISKTLVFIASVALSAHRQPYMQHVVVITFGLKASFEDTV